MPDTGMPAPCNVVAFAANLGLFGPDYTVTWNTDRYRTTRPPALDNNFIGADNRSGNTPEASGLRRVPTYYINDRAYHWAAGFNSVAAQTQQEVKRFKDEDYRQRLKDYKASLKKECLDVIEQAAENLGLGSIDEYIAQLNFFNMTKQGMFNEEGLLNDAEQTWSQYALDKQYSYSAYAPPGTSNILIFAPYYGFYDLVEKGGKLTEKFVGNRDRFKGQIMFHEFLHSYFQQNHANLLRTLGISAPTINPKLDSVETASSNTLNEWLKKCSTLYDSASEKRRKP